MKNISDFKIGDRVRFIRNYYIDPRDLPSGGWVKKGAVATVTQVTSSWIIIKTDKKLFRSSIEVPLFVDSQDPFTSIKCIEKID